MTTELRKPRVFLTSSQLAERWNLDPRTLEGWRTQRKGPPWVKLGPGKRSSVLYKIDDVVEWESQHMVRPQEGK